ncbi:MAG: 5-formyltetrahydrofolate cyclo-ligase [Oxalobacteraceae bacterium]|jgi:5-formyltetrahydrofolate cyclo-ligase|nr:5-formyltetrahydrofolate cyclo-ligase [Oxalobacteraceae bacterium]
MNQVTSKAELRRQLIAARRALAPDIKAAADARIIAKLLPWLQANHIHVLGAYLAIAGEPDMSALYELLPVHGITVAMPVVLEREQPLVFVRWRPGDALTKDASGTLAPSTRGEYLQPDAVLAPCIGYTDQNLRLGFGGGYFDRTLAQDPRPRAVGIAYAFAKVSFEAEAHDIPLDVILTD